MAQAKENGQNGKQAAYNVNASSMLGLLSEVSRHSEKHSRGYGKASTSRDTLDDAPRKKKVNVFDRANRGIEARSARDRSHMLSREEMSEEARRVLESREKLEKKAMLYEKLARGETVKGITREQLREGLLVDFETKAIEESYASRNDSSSEDDSDDDDEASMKKPEDDELVEVTDDLGRTRWLRKSELAQKPELRQGVMEGGTPMYSEDIKIASQSWHPADNQNTYYGDQRDFRVYEPTEEEIAARRKRLNLDAPLEQHFDASKEIRNRGAGFMQLSGDAEERKKQMEQLQRERELTEQERAQRQAAGDIQTQRDQEAQARKKLIEEKKRKLLEKRKAVEAEREEASKTRKVV